jgi:hypothetical protein
MCRSTLGTVGGTTRGTTGGITVGIARGITGGTTRGITDGATGGAALTDTYVSGAGHRGAATGGLDAFEVTRGGDGQAATPSAQRRSSASPPTNVISRSVQRGSAGLPRAVVSDHALDHRMPRACLTAAAEMTILVIWL